MLRSPCAQWLEADDMRAPTQRNPPQYSPECRCTQYAIVAHLWASSQLRPRTNTYNALILISRDEQSVHYLWNIDSNTLKTLRSRRHRALCGALIKARKLAGISQHELASRLKTSQTVIARIEIGERRIDVIEFLDLARALRLDPREILTRLMA